MVNIRVRDDHQGQPSRVYICIFHVGKDRLFRRIGNTGIDENNVVAGKEVLEEIPASVQGLYLMDPFVNFHFQPFAPSGPKQAICVAQYNRGQSQHKHPNDHG